MRLTSTTAAVGDDASCSKLQPSRSLIVRAPTAAAAAASCWAGGPSASRSCARGGGSSSSASVCVSPPIACVITAPRWNPHRAEVLDRDQPGDRLDAATAQPAARVDAAEGLAAHLDVELRGATALVGAAQDGDVGVVASNADLDVLARAGPSRACVDAEPAVRRDERLDPGVEAVDISTLPR